MADQVAKKSQSKRVSKNIVRGLASQIRGQQFDVDVNVQASNFRMRRKRAMLQARSELSPAEFTGWFERFERQNLRQINYVRQIPVGDSEILGIFPAPSIKLTDEIAWVATRISRSIFEINSFLFFLGLYNTAIWKGDLPHARAVLETIEVAHGQSIWLVCNRIALEQLDGGLESQKKYSELIGKRFRRGLVAYLAHYVSTRNEQSVSWGWFTDDILRRVSRSRYADNIKSYLKYHFTGRWPKDHRLASHVFEVEQSHSEVDVYETLVSFIENALSTPTDTDVLDAIRAALDLLAGVRDPRLAKAREILGLTTATLSVARSQAAEILLAGRPGQAYRVACRKLRTDPTAVHEALVAGFARSANVKNPFPGALSGVGPWLLIIPDLSILFRRDAGFTDAADRLTKFATNFGGTPAGKALRAAIAAESSTDATTESRQLRGVCYNLEWLTYCDARAGLSSVEINGDPASAFFASRFTRGSQLVGLDTHATAFAAAVAAADDQDWEQAATFAAVAAETKHIGLSARAKMLSMAAQTRLGLIDEVIEGIEREVATGGIATQLLPHTELVEGKPWIEFKPSTHRLGLPIALDLALKATGADKTATFRRFAYDAFLKSQGVSLASELEIENYPKRLISHFLEHVAVPSVLDMSDALDSSAAIQTERRSILSLLISIDPEQSAHYQDEIVDITDQLEVAEGLKLVDSSRIHVDTDAIETWARRELAESYTRYRILLRNGIGVADNFDTVLAGLKKIDEKSKHLFAIPDNEADELLVTIIRKLLSRFLYDPAHGLDSYLSRRIRHGSIVGFLRGPVEESQIVTLRREIDDSYAANTFWLERLSDLDTQEQQIISLALEEFARSFDDALLSLRDNLIQIRDKEHPHGLFDMQLYADQYHLIRSAIKEGDSFPVFVVACFASFWGLLDRYLRLARAYILEDLRSTLAAAFEKLRASVNQLYPTHAGDLISGVPRARVGVAELHTSIASAQSNLQAALEDVATWFTRSEFELASRAYTVQEAVNIGIRSALARLRRFTPDLDVAVDPSLGLPAADLSIIADIMLIAIGNACERSGMGSGTPVKLNVGLNETGDLLVFEFENPVAPAAQSSEKCSAVDTIRSEISTKSVSEQTRRDKSSGLRKLGALTMKYDNAQLSFGFRDGCSFYLRLALPFQQPNLESKKAPS